MMKKVAKPKAKPLRKRKAKKPTTVSMAKYNDLKKQTLALKKYLGDIRRAADKAIKPKVKKAAPKRKAAPRKKK
jgi:hypothetical protein